MNRVSPLQVRLSPEHRAKLEAHRKAFGLRSESEAVRHLIDRGIRHPRQDALGCVPMAGVGTTVNPDGSISPGYVTRWSTPEEGEAVARRWFLEEALSQQEQKT